MGFFEYFDFYLTVINFKVKGRKGYSTKLGFFFSIFTFILVFITIIFFGSDFYNRTNPDCFNQNYFPDKIEKNIITNQDFNIAWRIEDGIAQKFNFTNFLYPRLRYVLFEKNATTLELQTKHYFFETVKCNEVKINSIFMKNFDSNEWYCLDFSKVPVILGGDWSKDFIGFIGFEILFCPDNDFNLNCTNTTELQKTFGNYLGLYLSIIYPEVYVSNTDLVEPMKYQLKNYYNTITFNTNKIDRLFINKNFYVDDQGWIFSDKKTSTYISGYYFDRSFDFKSEDEYKLTKSSVLYTFNIYMDNKYIFYFRKFMKIQELAATVGGFMKILLLMFEVLNYLPNKFFFSRDLVNEFFFLDSQENISKNFDDVKLKKKFEFDIYKDKKRKSDKYLYHDNTPKMVQIDKKNTKTQNTYINNGYDVSETCKYHDNQIKNCGSISQDYGNQNMLNSTIQLNKASEKSNKEESIQLNKAPEKSNRVESIQNIVFKNKIETENENVINSYTKNINSFNKEFLNSRIEKKFNINNNLEYTIKSNKNNYKTNQKNFDNIEKNEENNNLTEINKNYNQFDQLSRKNSTKNEQFQFKEIKRNNLFVHKKDKYSQEYINELKHNIINRNKNASCNSEINKVIKFKVEKTSQKNFTKIEIGFINYIKNLFCFSKDNRTNSNKIHSLFSKASQKLMKKIDVFYYFKNLFKVKKKIFQIESIFIFKKD